MTFGAKNPRLTSQGYKVEQLLGIATDRSDLKPVGEFHAKRPSDFTILEKELTEIIDTFKYKWTSWKDTPPHRN